MDAEVTREVMTRLDALAAQLGVAVEQLWPMAVQHTMAQGITSIVVGIMVGIIAFLLGKKLSNYDVKDTVDKGALVGFAFFVWIIGATVCLTCFNSGIPEVFVPEGATIKALMQSI